MKDITKGNLSRNLFLFAVPVIISGVLSQAYVTVDKIMVGQIIGEVGLAAIGSTSNFITLLKSIIWGLGTGVSLYIAYLSTSGDKRRTVNAVKVNLVCIALIATVVSVLSILLYKPIFSLLAINDEIRRDAFIYYLVYLIGFVFFTFGNAASYIFNAIGRPSFPMKLAIFSCLGNVVLNYVFIAVFKLGVLGAALGSVIVAATSAVIYIVRLYMEFSSLGCGKERIRFVGGDIFPAWRLAVPCMIQQFIMYISGAAVQPAVNLLGTAAIASYSVCSEIYSVLSTVFQNSSRGLSPFCAQCYGKGDFLLVRRGVRVTVRQSILLSLPVIALFMLLPEAVAKLFLGARASAESVDYVVLYMLLCVPFVICQVVNNLFHNFYRGAMMPKLATFTTAVYTVLRIAITYALVWRLGMLGVFLGFVVPWSVECILSVAFYLKGSWKSELYRAAERENAELGIRN